MGGAIRLRRLHAGATVEGPPIGRAYRETLLAGGKTVQLLIRFNEEAVKQQLSRNKRLYHMIESITPYLKCKSRKELTSPGLAIPGAM
jgi:hypothetical protein